MSHAQSAPSEFREGWRPLVAALVGNAFGASPVPFNVLPLVIGPLHTAFGWSFGAIGGGIAIYGVLAALLAPVYGALADRHGVRVVALSSLAAFGIVFAAFGLMPGSLPVYYGICILLGLVAIGSTPVTWSRAVSLWFDRRRGIALGLMLLGTSVTGLLVPQITRLSIEAGGWRLAFPVVALLPLAVALPIGLIWFREPAVGADARDKPSATGLTLAEAMRGYRFWVLCGSIFVIALAYSGAYISIGQMIALHGLPPTAAASAISALALGILVGRVLAGFLFDHIWAPLVVLPTLIGGAIAFVLLGGTSPALAPLILAAFLLGLASGGETDVIAYMAARYFGMRFYGRIYGALYMCYALGASVSPFLYGAVRDRVGNYDPILWAAAAAFVAGGAAMLLLGSYPSWGGDRPADGVGADG